MIKPKLTVEEIVELIEQLSLSDCVKLSSCLQKKLGVSELMSQIFGQSKSANNSNNQAKQNDSEKNNIVVKLYIKALPLNPRLKNQFRKLLAEVKKFTSSNDVRDFIKSLKEKGEMLLTELPKDSEKLKNLKAKLDELQVKYSV